MQKNAAEVAQATAQAASILAKAGELSSLSDYFRDKDLELSLLLAIEAVSQSDTWETRKSLLDGLQRGVARQAGIDTSFQPACEDPQAIAFNPDGKLFATGCFDKRVNLWYTDGLGKAQQTPQELLGEGTVYAVAFDQTGKVLAVAGSERPVRFWDLQTGEVTKFDPFHGAWNAITAMAYQPGGNLLAIITKRLTGDQGQIIFYDSTTKKEVPSSRWGCGPYDCTALAWSQDGKKLAVGSQNGAIVILPAEGGGEIGSIRPAHREDVTGVAWYPDSRRIISGGFDGRLRQWDTITGQMLLEANPDDTPIIQGLALSPNGLSLVTGTTEGPPWVLFWDGETLVRNHVEISGHTQSITAVTVNADGSRFATASLDNYVTMWKFAPQDPLGIKKWNLGKSQIEAISINEAGKFMLARTVIENQVDVWTEDTAAPASFSIPHTSTTFATRQNQHVIVLGNNAGRISFIDANTGQPAGQAITVDSRPIGPISVSGNGKMLSAASCWKVLEGCNRIILWNLESNQQVKAPALVDDIHFAEITSSAFTQDGSILAIGGKPSTGTGSFKILFYNISTGELTTAVTEGLGLKDAGLKVTSLAFGLDGDSMLAAGFNDGRLALWETRSHNPIGEFNEWKEGPVTGLMFRKGDPYWTLISTTDTGQLVDWAVEKDVWVQKACKIAGGPLTTDQKIRFLYDANAPDICKK